MAATAAKRVVLHIGEFRVLDNSVVIGIWITVVKEHNITVQTKALAVMQVLYITIADVMTTVAGGVKQYLIQAALLIS
jgi:hypothetical protein